LQEKIGYLLKRPVGRPPHWRWRRYYASLSYQAQSWKKPRRVVAKIRVASGELYPRVGFIVTKSWHGRERVVAFYNQRGTRSSAFKEGKARSKMDAAVMPFLSPPTPSVSAPRTAYNLAIS